LKKNKTILLLIVSGFYQISLSQPFLSIATGLSLQRSFKQDQRYWAVGQDVIFNYHLSKTGVYASISYYTDGKFKNQLAATAKSATTSPQEISFTNRAELRLRQISLGWRYYVLGAPDAVQGWNLYGITGFGLIFGKATNTYSTTIDTSLYNAPAQPASGSGHFKRLTIDVGLGLEMPLHGDIFLYAEGKAWIPTTDYPSKYLFVNDNAPLTANVTAGLRIVFN
jgi:hypothetical protein